MDHLQLPDRITLPGRRRVGGRGSGPPPRQPSAHGRKLMAELDAALTSSPTAAVEGVDPRRVFKILATSRITDDNLRRRGLEFLGDSEDWSYVVVPTDEDAAELRRALDAYGAHQDPASSAPLAPTLDYIEAIAPYGPEDRLTPVVVQRRQDGPWPVVVDAVLWPSADGDEARRRIDDVRRAADAYAGTVTGTDYRPRSTVVRVSCSSPDTLDALAELTVVERIRLPLAPLIEPSDWLRATPDDFEPPSTLETRVCVLDDGVSAAHPLLRDVVVASYAFPPAHGWRDHGPHGTMVAGLAAYGGFEDAVRTGQLPEAVQIVVARILEPDAYGDPLRTHLPTTEPDHEVVEAAIRMVHAEQGVRVFNLSVTDPFPYSGPRVSPLTHTLDRLARELDIVVVIAAGNRGFAMDGTTRAGLHVLHDYPGYMHDDAARLAEPAPAANVLTVGSLGFSPAPSDPSGRTHAEDHVVAGVDRPSPFSRTGPGASGDVKPDIVAHGGDLVSRPHTVDPHNVGVSVVSLSHEPDQRLFRVASGTSFAAPRIANLGARILDRYPEASANLVRALIGIAASHPGPTVELGWEEQQLTRAIGSGLPSWYSALDSENRRVLMTFDGEMPCDKAVIHPIPMPREFTTGRADRTISVALAFDPPVRWQRREYLAGRIKMHLFRAVDLDQLAAVMGPDGTGEQLDRITDRRVIKNQLKPGSTLVDGSTLQVRRWTAPAANSLLPDDGDTYYLVLSHFREAWADRLDEEYDAQRYAVCVELHDRERNDINIYNLVQNQVRLPARVRVRG